MLKRLVFDIQDKRLTKAWLRLREAWSRSDISSEDKGALCAIYAYRVIDRFDGRDVAGLMLHAMRANLGRIETEKLIKGQMTRREIKTLRA